MMCLVWIVFTSCVCLTFLGSEAKMTRSCYGGYGLFYVPDDIDLCAYYKCREGQVIGKGRCPSGTGVNPFYSSNEYPCTIQVSTCIRDQHNAGPRGRVTYPPPTRHRYTPEPEATTASPDTTESATTEVIDVTTADDAEMTTQDVTTEGVTTESMTTEGETTEDMTTEGVTEEMGSGDGDEPLPGQLGAYFDYASTEPGVEVEATDQAACLDQYVKFASYSWGVDWDEGEGQCRIYISGEKCGAVETKPGNIHFRFKC